MNILGEKFSKSAQMLKKPQNLAICGMLLALRIVIGCFANVTLSFIPQAKLGFSFLPIAIAGILFGPVAASAIGALGDVICFFIVPPGAYFPGWTINGLLVGMLYGLFLFETKRFLPSLIICEVVIGVFIEIILGTLWLYIQFSSAYFVTAGFRGIKTLIAIPIEVFLIIIFNKTILSRLSKTIIRR